jgi:hypothetical protein
VGQPPLVALEPVALAQPHGSSARTSNVECCRLQREARRVTVKRKQPAHCRIGANQQMLAVVDTRSKTAQGQGNATRSTTGLWRRLEHFHSAAGIRKQAGASQACPSGANHCDALHRELGHSVRDLRRSGTQPGAPGEPELANRCDRDALVEDCKALLLDAVEDIGVDRGHDQARSLWATLAVGKLAEGKGKLEPRLVSGSQKDMAERGRVSQGKKFRFAQPRIL